MASKLFDIVHGGRQMETFSRSGEKSDWKIEPNAAVGIMNRKLSVTEEVVQFSVKGLNKLKTVASNRKNKKSFGEHFFGLPNELKLEIIGQLPVREIAALRGVNTYFRNFIVDNETNICRAYIRTKIRSSVVRFHMPQSDANSPTIRDLQVMDARRRDCNQLAAKLAAQIVSEMINSAAYYVKKQQIAILTRKLTKGLSNLLLGVYHFLEEYKLRKLRKYNAPEVLVTTPSGTTNTAAVDDTPEQEGEGAGADDRMSDLQIQYDILKNYSNQDLLNTHRLFDLMSRLVRRHLCNRIFQYFVVSNVFKHKIRNWNTSALRDRNFSTIYTLGGIPAILELYKIHGAGNRRDAVDLWMKEISEGKKDVKVREPEPWYRSIKNKLGWAGKDETNSNKPAANPCTPAGLPVAPPFSYFPQTPHPLKPATGDELKKIPIARFAELFLPASSQILLERKVIKNMEEIKCRTEFVCYLLGTSIRKDADQTLPQNVNLATLGWGGVDDDVWADDEWADQWDSEGEDDSESDDSETSSSESEDDD